MCSHEQARDINLMLVRGVRAPEVARLFTLKAAAVARHAQRHVPLVLRLTRDQEVALDADELMREYASLYLAARELLEEACAEMRARPLNSPARDRAYVMTAAALREAGRLWELGARMLGLDDPAKRGHKEPEVITIRVIEEREDEHGKFNDIIPPGRRALPPVETNHSRPERAAPQDTPSSPRRRFSEELTAILDERVPEELRLNVNRERLRKGMAPIPKGARFRDALELTDGSKKGSK